MVRFVFNSGEVKWLDKPIANRAESKGLGKIQAEAGVEPVQKEEKPVKADKKLKEVSKRKTK